MNFLGPVLNTLAKNNASMLIKYGTRLATAALGFGVVCYGIKTFADHDAMEHGYEPEIKIGKFETKLKRVDTDTTNVCIEPVKYQS